MNPELNPAQKGCVGCFVVIAILMAAIFIPAIIADSKRRDRIEAGMTGQPAASMVPAQLMADATGTYNDQVVQLRGMVVDKYGDSVGVLVTIGSGVGDQGIVCSFPPEAWGTISGWTRGQSVTVRGVVSSGFGTPTMKQCRIE